MTDKKTIPSLSSLRQSGTTNSLTQLKEKMQKPTSSLASLAAASSGNKPLTSLQSLAQKRTINNNNNNNNNNNSAPSLTSLAQNNNNKLNSLAHLASRTSSTTTTTTKSTNNSTAVPLLAGLANKPKATSLNITKNKVDPTPIVNEEKEQDQEQEEIMTVDPLIGKPSMAAEFLFKAQPKIVFDAQTVFERATRKPRTIQMFEFDTPSPDDVVLAAQSQRSGGNKR